MSFLGVMSLHCMAVLQPVLGGLLLLLPHGGCFGSLVAGHGFCGGCCGFPVPFSRVPLAFYMLHSLCMASACSWTAGLAVWQWGW